jgi:hypothetical protein
VRGSIIIIIIIVIGFTPRVEVVVVKHPNQTLDEYDPEIVR